MRSNETCTEYSPASPCSNKSFKTLRRAVSVECIRRKPDWNLLVLSNDYDSVVIKNPRMSIGKKSRSDPGQICPLASDHHGLLIIPIHWFASSLCLLFTNKLVCGGRSAALWLPLHDPGGCCTLAVLEEIPPFYVKRFVYPEKRYIHLLLLLLFIKITWNLTRC